MAEARFILNSRYIHVARNGEKAGKYALTGNHIADLVEYAGTRETVDFNLDEIDNEILNQKATSKQAAKIENLLKSLGNDYELPFEYFDYKSNPTVKTASELISRLAEELFIEENGFNEVANLVEYAAKRPTVYKVGEHGLFSSYSNVDLNKAMEELSTHKGNIWTHVLSIRREDAQALGYDCQKPWRDLVMAHIDEIAKAHNIKPQNMRWYGAMHNTTHHPHIHLFVYSTDPNEGFFSEKKDKSITKLKSTFVSDIFKEERHEIFIAKTQARDNLKKQTNKILEELIQNPNSFMSDDTLNTVKNQMLTLSNMINGKAEYKYQKAETKELVKSITANLVNGNSKLTELYELWKQQKYQLDSYYKSGKKIIIPPIEENSEFTSIKNSIIRQSIKLGQQMINSENPDTTPAYNDTHSLTEETETPTPNPPSASESNINLLEWLADNIEYNEKFETLRDIATDVNLRTADDCRNLADMYYYGNNCEKDVEQALMWYGIASDQYQDGISSYKLGGIYQYGAENIECNKQLANEYFLQAFYVLQNEIKNTKAFTDISKGNYDNITYFESRADSYKEHLLGMMYYKGYGVEQNYDKAYFAFSIAQENGYAFSNYYLANMSYYGQAVNQDYEKALSLYSRISEKTTKSGEYSIGALLASEKIGRMYQNGQGCEVDLLQAEKYYKRASNKLGSSAYDLAKLYSDNLDLFKNISADEIDRLYSFALKDFLKSEKNRPDSYNEIRIGNMFMYGQGTDIDVHKAIEYYSKAVDNGDAEASYKLGEIFQSEKIGIRNPVTARQYYSKALDLWLTKTLDELSADELYKIGRIYYYDLGNKENEIFDRLTTAILMLNNAVNKGSTNSAYLLGKHYLNSKDYEKAKHYFEIAVNSQNNAFPLYFLGNIYSNKQAPNYDADIAFKYYNQALNKFIQMYNTKPDERLAYLIATMLQSGKGCTVDIGKAIEYYQKCNSADAHYQLGYIYNTKDSNYFNPELANTHYHTALEQYLIQEKTEPNNSNLLVRIGSMYRYGNGCNVDIDKATEYYKRAAELGNEQAQKGLDEISQTNNLSLLTIASTINHIGNIIEVETHAQAKYHSISDSKQLREEKLQKIHSGQAVNDFSQAYNY